VIPYSEYITFLNKEIDFTSVSDKKHKGIITTIDENKGLCIRDIDTGVVLNVIHPPLMRKKNENGEYETRYVSGTLSENGRVLFNMALNMIKNGYFDERDVIFTNCKLNNIPMKRMNGIVTGISAEEIEKNCNVAAAHN
jgi:hypothetical protein